MRKTLDRVLIWVLLPIVVCAVMFGAEALLQLPKLSLPDAQKGTIVLDTAAQADPAADTAEEDMTDEETAGEEEYVDEEFPEDEFAAEEETAAAPAVSIPLAYTGYVSELQFTTPATTNQHYNVTWVTPDGATRVKGSYYTSVLGQDAIAIGDSVTSLTIAFDDPDTTLASAQINNGFVLNGGRMLFFGLLTACLYLLLAFRSFIGRKAEYGFLAVGLAVGLFLSIALPADVSLSYDDQIHYENVEKLSWFSKAPATSIAADDMSTLSWCYIENDSAHYLLDTRTDKLAYYTLLDQHDEGTAGESAVTQQWEFTDVGYVTQAAGYGLARVLGLPFHTQMIFARVAGMLTYVLLCFLGIRTLKRFKLTMSAVALMPTPMFLAGNFSYDPTSTGLCFLGIALVMDAIMDRDTKLTWQRGLGILLCFTLGALTKIVYMPLLLLVLLLPRSKFDTRGQKVWFKTAAVVLCVVAVGAMVSSVMGNTASFEDARGDGADSAGQLAFLMSHPLTYLGYFFSYLLENFTVYFLDSCRTTWAYVGSTTGTVSTLSLMLLLMACFTDNDPSLGQRLNWKQRLSMVIVSGLVIGMIFTTLYVAYSPVGVKNFGGVQGRYLLPVLPLLFMCLSPDGIHNRMNKTGWHLFFYAGNLTLLGYTCFDLVCRNLLA